MLNKRRKQERAKTAVQRGTYAEERASFGEEAMQALRNLSLINSIEPQDRCYKQWTKDQDNLSIGSFHVGRKKSSSKSNQKKRKFKTMGMNTRNSSPVILNASLVGDTKRKLLDPNRKQLVPSSLDINCRQVDQRIHTGLHKHNFIGGKQLNLFNEAICRKTAKTFNRPFRTHRVQDSSPQRGQRSFSNRIELTQRNGCSKILPLKVHDFSDVANGSKKQRKSSFNRNLGQAFLRGRANKIRKILKQQRMNSFNETIFQKSQIKPQF